MPPPFAIGSPSSITRLLYLEVLVPNGSDAEHAASAKHAAARTPAHEIGLQALPHPITAHPTAATLLPWDRGRNGAAARLPWAAAISAMEWANEALSGAGQRGRAPARAATQVHRGVPNGRDGTG